MEEAITPSSVMESIRRYDMTKKAMVEALKARGIEVNANMKKAEVEALYTEAENQRMEAQEAMDKINANRGTTPIEAEVHVRGLEAIEVDMQAHAYGINKSTTDLAHDFYEVYIGKQYEALKDEEGNSCKSFKSYINDFRGKKLFGVTYGMAMHYVNVHKHVMPHRPEEFAFYAIRVLIALVPYMKDEDKRGEVLRLVDNGTINDSMNLEEVKEVLEVEFPQTKEAEDIDGMEAEGNTEAEESYEDSNTCDISEEAMDEAIEIMEEFLECNAHDNKVTEAWYRILKYCDR
jgi:hypothetical protein